MTPCVPLIMLVASIASQRPGQDPDYLVALDSGYRLGTFAVPASPDGSRIAFTNTGIELPSRVAVRITIARRISGSGSGRTCSPPDAAAIGIGHGGQPPRDTLAVAPLASPDTFVTFGVGPGVVWVGRLAASPSRRVVGGRGVTVTVLPPPAVLVSPSTLVRGDTALARLSVPWAPALRAMDGWEWVSTDSQPAAPTRFIAGCGADAQICRFVIQGDGYLRLSQVQVAPKAIVRATSPVLHAIVTRMSLTVDSTPIHSGSWIVVKARLANGEPAHVESWVWTPLDSAPLGPIGLDCTENGPECRTTFQNMTPRGRGRPQSALMTARAIVGRDTLMASLTIIVEPLWR